MRAALAATLGLGLIAVVPGLATAPATDSVASLAHGLTVEATASGAGVGSGSAEDVAEPTAPARDLGVAVRELAALVGDPLLLVADLEQTDLEREEPERLYALVTREVPVDPIDYAPEDLAALPGDFYQAREEVVAQLTDLMAAAREDGHRLSVISGFRDHDTQAGTYQDWVRRAGPDRADQVSARPGYSEHQLGLAVDLAGSCSYQCFGGTPEGQWVGENAYRWGFIVRYPEGGDEVTGYAHEPWHLRYVGPRAATAMHLRGDVYWERVAPLLLADVEGN